jgi:glucose/arabinose dehydrogenase
MPGTARRSPRRWSLHLRRAAPAAHGLAAVLLCACPAASQPFDELALEPVVTGLSDPTGVAHASDPRLFVTLQAGRVVIVRDGRVLPRPFLDLGDRVLGGAERGLLSIAFHPRYAENGWFFVDYTDLGGDTVVSRFRVTADPDVADPTSERVLLTIPQPFANHNGGQLVFGPDGRLWIGTGDGGSGNDPLCNAQDPTSLLGKLLRLDVDSRPDQPPYHTVPPDNPFAGAPPGTARREVWALGLRNPWRFGFDGETGDLYIADVGQNAVEEVSFAAAGTGAGANYGWKVMEGTSCTGRSDGCAFPLPSCGHPSLVPPVVEYRHDEGCSVTGGFVYRGRRIDGLQGVYLYGDFCTGRVWGARRQGEAGWTTRELPFRASGLTSFGEDAAGEIYLAAGDTLHRLVGPAPPRQACVPGAASLCLGEGGRFAVEARFRTGGRPFRAATARPLVADSGAFWFFAPDNLELVVKVLDACVPFGRFWFFAAGLTDVTTELVVTDTVAGVERVYPKGPGVPFPPIQDTGAFATCAAR